MPTATLSRPAHLLPTAQERRQADRRECPIERNATGATLDVDDLRAMCGGEDPWAIVERSARQGEPAMGVAS